MKLPFSDEAEIAEAKLVAYLLDLNHRSGKSKARFFLGHGFSEGEPVVFADALRRHALDNEIVREVVTPFVFAW